MSDQDDSSWWGEAASQPCSSSRSSIFTEDTTVDTHHFVGSDSDDSLSTLAGYLAASELSDQDEPDSPGIPRPDSSTLGAFLPRAMAVNPLLSTQKSSDGLQVALHPLPILEISDYITRSFQRGYKGALVGALLGEPKGREITIEHSFTCGVRAGEDGVYCIDAEQFSQRLEQSTWSCLV